MMFAKLLSFAREVANGAHVSRAKVDTGGKDIRQATHVGAPGDDSYPRNTDVPVLVPATGSGSTAAVGYIDTENQPQAGEGERRLYSRDSDGAVAMVVWMKADGTLELGSPDDFVALASKVDQRFDDLEQALIDHINTAFNAHTHVAPTGGTSPPSPTGSAPSPGDPTGSQNVKVQS